MGGPIVPMLSGGLGLWASWSREGHGKETSLAEETKWLADGSFRLKSIFKDPCLFLNLTIHLWSWHKAPESQRQSLGLWYRGYLINKRFLDSECNAVCKLGLLCEQVEELKPVSD